MALIQYIGLKNITSDERRQLEKLVNKFSPKLERALPNLDGVKLHIKKYRKQGKRSKISIRMKAMVGNKVFEGHANDWDLKTVAHKVFDDIENQLEHHIHVSDQKPKNVFKRTWKKITPEFAQRIGVNIHRRLGYFLDKRRR